MAKPATIIWHWLNILVTFFCTIGKCLTGKMENNSIETSTRCLTDRVFIFLDPVDERELPNTINLLAIKKLGRIALPSHLSN